MNIFVKKAEHQLHSVIEYGINDSSGFTMIEIIIAISVLLFGVVLVYGAFAATLAITNNTSSRFIAAYLAQEGLEIVRNARDDNFIAMAGQDPAVTSWSQGLTGGPCNVGCMTDYTTDTNVQNIFKPYDGSFLRIDGNGLYSYDAGTLTIFQRKITITPVVGLSDAINVSSQVFWSYEGVPFSFTVNEYLYNWY